MSLQEITLERVSDTPEAGARGDVIFIHGLGGDARDTWTNSRVADGFWPSWLAEDVPQARVWALGYLAPATRWTTRGAGVALPDRAKGILDYLSATELGHWPIVFVAHSLGGLIVKKILQLADSMAQPHWCSIGRSVRGVLFFGTPHSGSSLADLAAALVLVRPSLATTDLRAESPYLRELGDWYRQNVSRLRLATHAYYELEKVAGRVLVVTPSSADPGVEGCVAVGLDGDHFEICKPLGRASPAYVGTLRFICDCLGLGKQARVPKPDFELEVAPGSHRVYPGASKYEKNAQFSFDATFFLHASGPAITVLGFEGLYAAYGCYALNGVPRLVVNEKRVPISGADFFTLLQPVQIAKGESVLFTYSRDVRPPLTVDKPADCDLGDLEIRILYKSVGSSSCEAFWYFRYDYGDVLEAAPGLRNVPLFTDDHLATLRESGRINQADMDSLLSFSPQKRYLVARSDNPDGYPEMPNELRKLLKQILQES